MFYDKYFESLNLEETISPFNVVMFGFKELCLEGKYNITIFLENKIILSFKKHQMFIYGKNLKIKTMDKLHIHIYGEIETIANKELLGKQNEQNNNAN